MATTKNTLSFKPKQATKRLLSSLAPRARDILTSRYGLGTNTTRQTLESIGQKYNITRERVRQIENYSLNRIRNSKEYEKEQKNFKELKAIVKDLGGIVAEEDILEHISKSKSIQNHVHFLLVVGEEFSKEKENSDFKHRWHIDQELSDKIHNSLHKLYENLSDDELVSEPDFVTSFLKHMEDVAEEYKNEEAIKRWLRVSKKIDKNPLGEWGRASSKNINAKGMRDYAFLVIRKHGSPIHFREVARQISEVFDKKAHVATTHNELIKDPRFVLVGRGLYALSEWGYASGVVKDVIAKVLKDHGPLKKEDIIKKVMKERYVKENTILVNLQNNKMFKKDSKGKYYLAKK